MQPVAGGDPHRRGDPRRPGAARRRRGPRASAHADAGLRPPDRVRRPGRGLPAPSHGARAGVSADSEQAPSGSSCTARQELQARLRAAILRQAGSAAEPMTLEAAQLDELVDAAAARAGGVLWRRCLAGAATTELGVELAEAVSHPTVRAPTSWRAPRPTSASRPNSLAPAATPDGGRRTQAHRPRFRRCACRPCTSAGSRACATARATSSCASPTPAWTCSRPPAAPPSAACCGQRSTASRWPSSRRGLRPGRRVQELHVRAQSGQAVFQLPGMTSEQVNQHLEPALARLRGEHSRS